MSVNPNSPGGQPLSSGAATYLAMLGAAGDVSGVPNPVDVPPWQQGRVPVTGSRYNLGLGLPSWLDVAEVQRAAATAAQHGDLFDPYFGTISNGEISTGASVYWGRGKKVRVETGKVAYSHNEHMVDGEMVNTPTTVRETTERPGDKHLTVSAALNQPYMWSDDEQRKQLAHAVKLGLLSAGATLEDFVTKVWTGAVWRAAKTYDASQGQRKVTPFDVIDLYGKEFAASGGYNASGQFTGTHTQTDRTVNQLTEGEAWNVLRTTLSQSLGRDPSDRELRNFTYKMNSLAAKNPSITHTTQHIVDGQVASQNSTSTGGFTEADAAESAYNQAQDSPEYGAYQAASTYFNATQSALASIGNVGGQ